LSCRSGAGKCRAGRRSRQKPRAERERAATREVEEKEYGTKGSRERERARAGRSEREERVKRARETKKAGANQRERALSPSPSLLEEAGEKGSEAGIGERE